MPRRVFSLFYPALPPEDYRSCYGGVGEMLPLTVRDEVGRLAPEGWALPLLRRAAAVLVPGYDAPAVRREGKGGESRDDNGAYISEGSYREGNARHYLTCDWTYYQHEEMIGPAPWRRNARFQARGLGRGKLLVILVSRSGPGFYSDEADEAFVVVRIQAPEEAIREIERLVLEAITVTEITGATETHRFSPPAAPRSP